MSRVPGVRFEPVYATAATFVQQALATAGSLFTPDRPVWIPTTISDLLNRHRTAGDAPGDRFERRWDRRLGGAGVQTVQLAAEIAYVHVLFADDLSAPAKRRLVTGTLARAPDPPEVPEALDAALQTGIAGSGTAFKLRRMSQLGFLIETAARWWDLEAADRTRTLADPAAFRTFLHGVPSDGAAAQREALLHLVHPDAFEAIVSPGIKQRIVDALSRHVPAGVDDVDAALAGIRAVLERRYGPGFRFVDPPVEQLWR